MMTGLQGTEDLVASGHLLGSTDGALGLQQAAEAEGVPKPRTRLGATRPTSSSPLSNLLFITCLVLHICF